MKKLLCLSIVFMFVFLLSNSATAVSENSVVLSELSDEECVAFLKSHGVEIPNIYEDEIMCVPFARTVIIYVEEDPNAEFIFNYHVLEEFANDIKIAVNQYYGVNNMARGVVSYENILEDNTLHGDWKNEYANYRCYSYILGIDYYVQPGEIDWEDSGSTGDFEYNYSGASVLRIAQLTSADLVSLGYTVTYFDTTIPNTQVSSHTHLICTRKGTGTFTDYHFMKLGHDGYWYHKPGRTNPLKYIHVPTIDNAWVVEGYDGITGKYSRYEEYQYDSEIYFIEYTTPHTHAYAPCGVDQHILTCTICGQTSGLALPCMFVNNVCQKCGHIKITDGGIITSLHHNDGE